MAPILLGDIKVTAGESANALLIVSVLKDFLLLKPAIDKLDELVPQAFIEAVVMEVGLETSREMGLAHHVARQRSIGGRQSLFYHTVKPHQQLNTLLASTTTMSGLATGVIGPGISGSYGLLDTGMSLPSFGMALQALQTNANVNVLSTPYIQAIDNEKATISVGENIPIQTGYNPAGALLSQQINRTMNAASVSSNALASGGRSYRRQDVGLTLKITPHTRVKEQIRLEVDMEVSGLKSVDPVQGADLSKRHATTTMVVSEQQTVVIGGLITDKRVETTKRVTFFGDIPIVGLLFRHSGGTHYSINTIK